MRVHGIACFKVGTGEVEDAPAIDPLSRFPLFEKDGSIYIKGEEERIKSSRGVGDIQCAVESEEKVVIVGGYVCRCYRDFSASANMFGRA